MWWDRSGSLRPCTSGRKQRNIVIFAFHKLSTQFLCYPGEKGDNSAGGSIHQGPGSKKNFPLGSRGSYALFRRGYCTVFWSSTVLWLISNRNETPILRSSVVGTMAPLQGPACRRRKPFFGFLGRGSWTMWMATRGRAVIRIYQKNLGLGFYRGNHFWGLYFSPQVVVSPTDN